MVRIRFNELNVDQVTKSSGIFSGKNQQLKWRSESKINQGFGTITGDKNNVMDQIQTVIHSDPNKGIGDS